MQNGENTQAECSLQNFKLFLTYRFKRQVTTGQQVLITPSLED